MKKIFKKYKILFVGLFAFVLIFGYIIFGYVSDRVLGSEIDNKLINISDLSDEFIDNYLEEISSSTEEEKENMLIVISSDKIKDSFGASNIIEAPNNQYMLLYDSDEEKNIALEKLKEDKRIDSVEENGIYSTEDVSYNSWGIEEMSLDYAITTSNNYSSIMEPVTVAIIDSGCDMSLFNKYYSGKIVEYYNVLENSTTTMIDEDGHGTHVAGTIAEGTPDNVKIMPFKVSTDGNMYHSDIIAAINYIVRYQKADVINMSFGGYGYSKSLEQAIESARQNNIISVAAAGNGNTSKKHYPSAFDNTISVASIDSTLNKSSFSNYGTDITFAAPGTSIKSIMGKDSAISKAYGNADGDDDHETISGTSMATPHVVSAVAVLKGYNKNLTLENVIDILKDNTVDLGEEGWDQYYGYGLISFNGVEFCDGRYCDTYHVYKDLSKNIVSIDTTNTNLTQYNYYSITNLLGSKVEVTYVDSTTEEIEISDLPNVEILNYDPLATGSQDVTINIGTLTTTISITNPNNYESGWEYNILDNGNIEITGYKDHGLEIEKLYVPEMIDSKQVVSFADNFKFSESGDDIDNYIYLYLPSTFNRIGNYSLSNTNIKYVYGSSKIEIGAHAFENSEIVSIENSLIKIEEYSFKDCFKLKFIKTWQETGSWSNVLVIEKYAFYNCKKLASIEITNESDNIIGDIGEYAFYNCILLSNFELVPGSNIYKYAFYNTLSLNNIDLSNTSLIEEYAFYSSGISEADFGSNFDTVNESSFENCKNLKEVSFTYGRIESKAFWNSGVEIVSIAYVEYIAEDAFAYSPINHGYGVVDSGNNSTYDVVSDLGIVEKATNKLVVGFTDSIGVSNTDIPEYITEIGKYAFTGNNSLEKITIPSTVTNIGEYAFEDCYNLSDVYMLGESVNASSTTFKRNYSGEMNDADLKMYVYKNSSIKQYAIDNDITYRYFEPDSYEVINLKDEYVADSFFTGDDFPKVKLIYNEAETREEIVSIDDYIKGPISKGYALVINYQNPYSGFVYGDTYITISFKTSLGYDVCNNVQVPIVVVKATPTYSIPKNLTGHLYQKLSDIELPAGFSWMDGDIELTTVGMSTYKAKYTPSDTNNYEIVENIDLSVMVDDARELLVPDIQINDKIYDGTNNIPFENINILNLETDEYTIVSATSSSSQPGSTTAIVKIKLSDEKFKHYFFEGNLQEKEFNVELNIVQNTFVFTSSDKEIIYDGLEHTIDIDIDVEEYNIKYSLDNINFNLDTIPKFKDVGEYTIYYKITKDGYNDYTGSNKVKIYGIRSFDSSITLKNNILVVSNKSFTNLKNKINIYAVSKSFSHLDNNNNIKSVDNINTGDKIKININGTQNYLIDIAYLGDVNGDGVIGIIDYIRIMKDIMGTNSLSGVYLEAADMNRNNSIDIIDYIRVMKVIMEG